MENHYRPIYPILEFPRYGIDLMYNVWDFKKKRWIKSYRKKHHQGKYVTLTKNGKRYQKEVHNLLERGT